MTKPFNYGFSDSLPRSLTGIVSAAMANAGRLTPVVSRINTTIMSGGLNTFGTNDIWGKSKNVLLYIRPTTLRVTANGYAVITRRDNVQHVIHDFTQAYRTFLDDDKKLRKYPINNPVEIRVTGLDQPAEVAHAGALSPLLSPSRRWANRPDWNVAVWLDILTTPGTEHSNAFFLKMEEWIFKRFAGKDAAVRPEWSKGWGYTNLGPWRNAEMLDTIVPEVFSEGQDADNDWPAALRILEDFDPFRLFSSPLLDRLFKQMGPGVDLADAVSQHSSSLAPPNFRQPPSSADADVEEIDLADLSPSSSQGRR